MALCYSKSHVETGLPPAIAGLVPQAFIVLDTT